MFSGRGNFKCKVPHVEKGWARRRQIKKPSGQKSGQQEGEWWLIRLESEAQAGEHRPCRPIYEEWPLRTLNPLLWFRNKQ